MRIAAPPGDAILVRAGWFYPTIVREPGRYGLLYRRGATDPVRRASNSKAVDLCLRHTNHLTTLWEVRPLENASGFTIYDASQEG